jgi:hypothetical protein
MMTNVTVLQWLKTVVNSCDFEAKSYRILIEEFIAKKKWSDKIVESMKKFKSIKFHTEIA